MRFAYLGSGSQGNGLIVEAGATRALLDCGFTVADTVARLARIGLLPEDLAAVVVTHEHDDHVGGVPQFARRFKIPVWITHGTLRGIETSIRGVQTHVIHGYQPFEIGDLRLTPYPVPHDAREPAQFVFSDGARKLGVLTDVGCATSHIQTMLSGCDALALECNHDLDMLWKGAYPAQLKRRIAGKFGHMDNAAAANLLRSLDNSKLRHVIAVHLSQQNNSPALARAALSGALNCDEQWIAVADQALGLDWREI